MANKLKLEIVTPDLKAFSGEVDMVTLPGAEGEMGIYPDHVPLLTQVVPGEVAIRQDGKDQYMAIGEGFVEVTADRVAILTDMAIGAASIDEAKVEEARRRAEARLAEQLDDEEAAVVNAALAHSLAQLKVKRHRH